jgi:hypothetical protein
MGKYCSRLVDSGCSTAAGSRKELVTGISANRLRKHSTDLYHHAYPDRPAGQMAALLEGTGSRPCVHTLAPKRARLLSERFGLCPNRASRDIVRGHLVHKLKVRVVLVAADLAWSAD